jgi:hypothetical protein
MNKYIAGTIIITLVLLSLIGMGVIWWQVQVAKAAHKQQQRLEQFNDKLRDAQKQWMDETLFGTRP